MTAIGNESVNESFSKTAAPLDPKIKRGCCFGSDPAREAVGRVSWERREQDTPMVKAMERDKPGELEGQTSVNELLDDPIGATPMQMSLPILVQIRPGEFRCLS